MDYGKMIKSSLNPTMINNLQTGRVLFDCRVSKCIDKFSSSIFKSIIGIRDDLILLRFYCKSCGEYWDLEITYDDFKGDCSKDSINRFNLVIYGLYYSRGIIEIVNKDYVDGFIKRLLTEGKGLRWLIKRLLKKIVG